jgi:phage terminase large subunit
MPTIKVPDYTPSERQTAFHQADADEILYGGAAGGGKSAALVAEAITLALEYPGIPIDIFRRTIPELKSTILPEIHKQAGAYIEAGHMTYHGLDRQFRLANGSTINLNYLDTDADIYRYQGREMPVILVDELTQFPQSWIEYIKTRNRTSNPDHPVIFRAGTNPGGVGHGWVKNYFIDITQPEVKYTDPETKLSRMFIPAKVSDHPLEKFREDYAQKLGAISDIDLRRALLEGDWDVFSGQVFTEWRRDKHVVEPFAIPEHWNRWFAYDYGYNTFAAGLWFTKDPTTDRIFVYREFYESQMAVSKQAELMNSLDRGERVAPNLADPAIWKSPANAETGETVAALFSKAGRNFVPANNERIAGKNAVHEALATAPDGLPKMQIFSNCVNLIRTLPSLPYDRHRVEDVDTKVEDHLYDVLRYGLINQKPAKAPTVYIPQNMLRRKQGRT